MPDDLESLSREVEMRLSLDQRRAKFLRRLGPSPSLEDVAAAVWKHGPIIMPARSLEDFERGQVAVTGVATDHDPNPKSWEVVVSRHSHENSGNPIKATIHRPLVEGVGQVRLERNEDSPEAWKFLGDDDTQPSLPAPAPPPENPYRGGLVVPKRNILQKPPQEVPWEVLGLAGLASCCAVIGALTGLPGVLMVVFVGALAAMIYGIRRL